MCKFGVRGLFNLLQLVLNLFVCVRRIAFRPTTEFQRFFDLFLMLSPLFVVPDALATNTPQAQEVIV